MTRPSLAVILSVAIPFAGGAAPAADAPRHELTQGDIRVVVEPWRAGWSVSVGGVWVLRGCELVVTRPPWAPHYYHGPAQDAVREARVERGHAAQSITLRHRGADGAFDAAETITLHADNRVEQVLEGQFNGPADECLIQWRIAGVNPALLAGMPFRAIRRDREDSGDIAFAPRSGELKDTTVARGFTRIEIDSRLGPLAFETDSVPALILYDFRQDKWANPDDPLFWFGDLGSRFKRGQPIRYRVVYHLPTPAAASKASAAPSASVRVEPRTDAQTFATADPPTLIPRPKQLAWGGAWFDATALVGSWLMLPARIARPPGSVPSDLPPGGEWLLTTIARNLGPPLKPAPFSTQLGDVFRIERRPLDPPRPEGGYRLMVGDAGVAIAAADDEGLLNALRTLAQLTVLDADGRARIRHADITDWPSLPFRGVHLFTGGAGPDLHLRLLERVLGPLKMNHLVLQSEYIKWDCCPEIHHAAWGMSKDDVKAILQAAGRQAITVTPLVMSLGHMQWMFENNQNLDLAEDPEARWAYTVTNPASYDFIFKVYDEAIDLFKPRWFHIGHDEFADRGRVPHRESSKPYTVEQLFLMDMDRMTAFARDRDVRIMIWGDMLLAPGEAPDACNAASKEAARRKRDAIPDDVIITDWHYVAAPHEKLGASLSLFRDAGHAVIAAGWNRPGNIVNFARAAFEQRSLGYLQTTWAGYSLDADSFAVELPQYAAYVLAAESAWNADNPPDPERFAFMSHFLDVMRLTPLPPANHRGWTADLSPAATAPASAAGGAEFWRGVGAEHDLSTMPAGDARLKGVAFTLAASPADAAQPALIALRSRLAPLASLPTQVELALDAPAHRLVILHATQFECGRDQKIGEYELVFDDGRAVVHDVIYGRNVFAYTNPSATATAPILWSGLTNGGEPIHWRAMVLDAARGIRSADAAASTATPRVKKLILRAVDSPASLIVAGVTGLIDAPLDEAAAP